MEINNIILFDKNRNQIGLNTAITENHLYIYSYVNFEIELIESTIKDNSQIYSLKEIDNKLDIISGTKLSNNFGYTLYFDEETKNENLYSFKISYNNFSRIINIKVNKNYSLNTNSEEYKLHLDLLTNKNLPKYNEIELALFNKTLEKQDIIKRLLLDYYNILKFKGTKETIIRLFQFLGYFDDISNKFSDRFKILDIFADLFGNKSLNNSETSIKTGDYYILYEMFETSGLDLNRLPINKFDTETDINDFIESLKHAIIIAEQYFLSLEQNINLFGLIYSSNIPKETSVTSTMNMIFNYDNCWFRHSMIIDIMVNNETIVRNRTLKNDNIVKTSVNFESYSFNPENKFNVVNNEISDELLNDYITVENINRIYKKFGNIYNIEIKNISNKNIKFKVEFKTGNYIETFDIDNKLSIFSNENNVTIVIKGNDEYGSIEEYFYNINSSVSTEKIDFVINYVDINGDIQIDNINGILSNNDNKNLTDNIILKLYNTPENLSTYYENVITENVAKYLGENKTNYNKLSEINFLYLLKDITDIPLNIIESYINYIIVKKTSKKENLLIKINNKYYNLSEDYEFIKNYYGNDFDYLYVQEFTTELEDNDSDIEYNWYISANTVGVDIIREIYDLYVYRDKTYISIFDLTETINNKIDIFNSTNININEYTLYIAGNKNTNIDSYYDYMFVYDKKIFKLGDIININLNDKLISNIKNIEWTLSDYYTNKVIKTSTNTLFNYRVDKITLFNIECKFYIDNIQYIKKLNGIFSSYSFKLDDIQNI